MPILARLLPLSLIALARITTAKQFYLPKNSELYSYHTTGYSTYYAAPGILLLLGTPGQQVYLAPSVFGNEISVAGPAVCNSTCLDMYSSACNSTCPNQEVSQFTPSFSSTWDPATEVFIGNAGTFDWWNGSKMELEYTRGYEEGEFVGSSAGDISLSKLGIEIAVLNQSSLMDGLVPQQNSLGLGSNSTFLNSLVRTGVIESRSFGMYGGSVDIGGFNESRIVGKRYPLPIVQNTTGNFGGLQVTVADMTINGKSLMTRTPGPFNATLGPTTRGVSYVPQVVAEDFFNLTAATAPSNWTYSEPIWDRARTAATSTFVVVVELSNGATFNIPSGELKNAFGTRPGYAQYYTSGILGIDALDAEVKADNPGIEALFGLNFFYNTYIYVDWDKQEFELATAKDMYKNGSTFVVHVNLRMAWAMIFLSVAVTVML